MIHHTTHRATYTPFPPQRSLHRARLCDSGVYAIEPRVDVYEMRVSIYATLYRGVSVKYQDGTRLEKGRNIAIAKFRKFSAVK